MNLQHFKQLNWPKIFSGFFDFFILALVFGTPLYLSLLFKTNNIFDFGKIFWFQICLFSASFFLLLKIIILSFKKEKLTLPGFLNHPRVCLFSLLLIFFLSLSLIWSQDAYQSFFGSYYRNDGLINWFSYFLFAVLIGFYLVSAGKEKINKRLKIIFIAATSSATLVSIYAICQYFGIDFMSWQEPASISHRASSTLFQPNFLASFLLLTIPLAGFLVFSEKKQNIRWIFLSAGISQIMALIFTGSRGAWISFLVAIVIFAVILFFQNKKNIKKRNLFIGGVSLILLLVISGLVSGNRFRSLADFSTGSGAYRVQIYQAAISQIKQSPWIGFGYENQGDRLAREYQKDWAVFESARLMPDRAHNLILDLTLCFGVIGLLFWLIWYNSIFYRLKIISKKSENYPLAFTLSFSFFSYLFSLLFSFSVATTTIYFFLLFGIVLAFSDSAWEVKTKKLGTIPLFIFLVISGGLFVFSCRTAVADYYFYYFNQAWNIQKYDNAFRVREDIINLKIADKQYRRMMLEKMTNIQSNYQNNQIIEQIKKISEQDKKLFKQNLFFDLKSLVEIEVFNGDFQQAEEYGEALSSFSPFYPKTYYLSGLVKFREGNYGDARAFFGQASTLLPDSLDFRLNEAHKKDILLTKSEIFFAAGATYENEKNWRNASSYYGLSFLNNEKNLAALSRIAFCFDQLGENDRAEAIRAMLANLLKK